MILETLADYLEPKVDYPVFVNHMPESVEIGILLLSPLTGIEVDPEIPNYFVGQYEAVTRHTSTAAGIQLAKSVADLLKIYEQQVGDLFFKYSQELHMPVVYPESDMDYLELSTNFEFCCYKAT